MILGASQEESPAAQYHVEEQQLPQQLLLLLPTAHHVVAIKPLVPLTMIVAATTARMAVAKEMVET